MLSKGKIIFLIFIALAIGVIYFLPNILTPHFYNQEFETDHNWKDMAYYSFEEIFSYGASIRDILKGHYLGGDPFLWEYKNIPTSWDYYPLALVIGLIFKIFHLGNLGMFFVVGDFIFPPISFIIIFFLFFRITKSFLFSIASSIIFLFFPNIFVFKELLSPDISFLKISNLFISAFNKDASRLFVPGITMIFLGTFLFFLYYSISKSEIKKKCLVLAGISYGLLFYVYFYYWVFATIALGFLGIFYWFYKKSYFWRILRIFSYGIIVAIPYWIRFFILAGNPIYSELQQRIGLLYGRVFVWSASNYFILFFIFFGCLFWRRIKDKNLFFYVAAFLLTILVVKNLQLIFGFNPQPDHWGSRISVYIFALSCLVIAYWLLENIFKKYKSSAFILFFGIIFLFFIAISGQILHSIESARVSFFIDEDVRNSFDWINKNLENDAVVITDSEIMRTALAFYTNTNSYLPHACLSLASDGEIQERYREVFAIYGVPSKMVADSFKNDFLRNENYSYIQKNSISSGFPMFCASFFYNQQNKSLYQDATDEFIAEYQITEPSIKDLKYRADYLFFGPYERVISDFDADKYPELSPVYSNDSVKIYKILK